MDDLYSDLYWETTTFPARTAGTSFTITSSSGSDTSTVAWLMPEPG